MPTCIGVAFDASPESDVALAHAACLAEGLHSEVVVRRILEPRLYTLLRDIDVAPVVDRRREVPAAAKPYGPVHGYEVEYVHWAPHEALLQFSESIDLLVCGSRRHWGAQRLLLGSTSAFLAQRARVPLLVAPPMDSTAVATWLVQEPAESNL